MTHVTYEAGPWVAVMSPNCWLLAELSPHDAVVEQSWSMLSSGGDADDVLELLAARGLRAIPPFALASAVVGGWRVVVRGSARIQFLKDPGGSAEEVMASRRSIWADEEIGHVAVLSLRSADDPPAEYHFPMAGGVALAAAIHIRVDDSDGAPPLVQPTIAGNYAAPKPPVLDAEAAAPEPAEPEDLQVPSADVLAVRAPVVDMPEADAPPADVLAVQLPDDEALRYDHLFGATSRKLPAKDLNDPVADPATEAPEVDGPTRVDDSHEPTPIESMKPRFGVTAGWNTVDQPNERNLDPLPMPVSAPGTLIDSVPGMPGTALVSPVPVSMQAPVAAPEIDALVLSAPDDVLRTTNRAALLADLQSESPIAGATVLAVRCPNGHVTSAHSATCRLCDAPVAAQTPTEVARPALGLLRLSTGDTMVLDRGVIIGRAPTVPDGVDELPHLLRVVSPDADISRNHAEIVLDDWLVLIRDLGSTNGTTLTLPGQVPTRLRANELQALERGAVISFADEISCTYEVIA